MDLKRGELALTRLEKEAANLAAVGALRQDLETLGSTLTETAVSLGAVSEKLNEASTSYKHATASVRNTLAELETRLDELESGIEERVKQQIDAAMTQYTTLLSSEVSTVASDIEDRVTKRINAATTQYSTLLRSEVRNVGRDVEERVRNQVNSATTQYGSLLRAEVQAIVDRMDLNQRDEKQFLEQSLTNLAATLEAKSTQLEAKHQSRFKWLFFAMVISAFSVAISVILKLS